MLDLMDFCSCHISFASSSSSCSFRMKSSPSVLACQFQLRTPSTPRNWDSPLDSQELYRQENQSVPALGGTAAGWDRSSGTLLQCCRSCLSWECLSRYSVDTSTKCLSSFFGSLLGQGCGHLMWSRCESCMLQREVLKVNELEKLVTYCVKNLPKSFSTISCDAYRSALDQMPMSYFFFCFISKSKVILFRPGLSKTALLPSTKVGVAFRSAAV